MKKNKLFGSNEKGSNLNTITNFGTPDEGYPIFFGKGADFENALKTILSTDDNKVRFVYDIMDGTGSGAVFVGKHLVSSKIVDIQVTDITGGIKNVTVKYIKTDDPVTNPDLTTNGDIVSYDFQVTDPETISNLLDVVEQIKDFLQDGTVTVSDTDSGLTIEKNADPETGLTKTDIKVNVDDETIAINDNNALFAAKYKLEKLDIDPESEDAATFSAKYALMKESVPGSGEYEQVDGSTIDILKDFFLEDAHVCTFNIIKDNNEYKTWNQEDHLDPVSGHDAYAVVYEEKYAEEQIDVLDGETLVNPLMVEKAPKDRGLFMGHTYLHLIVNTKPDSEKENGGNDTSSDVYLDFTEIIGSGAFKELTQKVDELERNIETIDERITELTNNYVKAITVPESVDGEQFKTVSVTSNVNGVEETTSFDIADAAYYESVQTNFETLEANDAYFKSVLTWQGLI